MAANREASAPPESSLEDSQKSTRRKVSGKLSDNSAVTAESCVKSSTNSAVGAESRGKEPAKTKGIKESLASEINGGKIAGFDRIAALLEKSLAGPSGNRHKRRYSAYEQSDYDGEFSPQELSDFSEQETENPSQDGGPSRCLQRTTRKRLRVSEMSLSGSETEEPMALGDKKEASSTSKSVDDEFLANIVQDYELEDSSGGSVNEKLAAGVTKMARNKLTEEKLKEKLKKYHKPSSCESLTTLKVNPEIWSKLRPVTRERDLKFQQIQTALFKAATPLVLLTNKLMGGDEDWMKNHLPEARAMLSDSMKLILHCNTEISQRRKDLIRPDLHKHYHQIYSQDQSGSPPATYLFGDDLAQKVKDINATNRVGQRLSDRISSGTSYRSSRNSSGYRNTGYSKNCSRSPFPQGRQSGNRQRQSTQFSRVQNKKRRGEDPSSQ